ncbi:putative RIO1 family protein kinase [Piedraia hortae CBS 480.64]|uniref:Serine/threonine-protein kinase RIO2 n=1 Tax=Piedraia hortae CBS 480.64 TaxID=1314780 RepID=A0A6A7C9E0_9PEZI|nr:putative RIO1 family protein kinase [Piedraia hortae CBS 480.64]
MKLDTRALRYLTAEDWRVLQAVEQGSKNHELVPTPLIQQISDLGGGGRVHKCISNLAKVGLIAKMKNAKYDGYRLTYGGIDYLALNSHRKANNVFSLGNQIGVGKESDIYITASPDGRQLVLKLHRLGRISFRSVKANRDYLRNRSTGSWMYLSRLAAQKEYAFMRVLHREGFPVPQPIAWNRHTVLMEFVDAFPLRMVEHVADPGSLYAELMDIIVRLARRGLIHGDFNEFNILVKDEEIADRIKEVPIVIDFPQTVSTNHANAEMYFDRDVACIKRYFERRFKYTCDDPGPHFKETMSEAGTEGRLDVEVEASGFSKKLAKQLERFVEPTGETEDKEEVHDHGSDEEEYIHEHENDDGVYDHESGDKQDVDGDKVEPLLVDEPLPEPLPSLKSGSMPLGSRTTAAHIKSQKKATGWAI